jgi:tetratricopeptide (TPR) repeat protein
VYLWNEKEYEAAERELRRAIDLDPDYATAHHWLGLHLTNDPERFDEGMDHLRRAEILDPVSRIIKMALAGELQRQDQVGQAIEKYLEVRQLDPAYPVDPALAWAYFRAGEFDAAIETMTSARERKPFRPGDWDILTTMLHLRGRHEQELREARQARAENPRSVPALALELRALGALGRTEDMLVTMEDLLELPAGPTEGIALVQSLADLLVHGREEAAGRVGKRLVEWHQARDPAERAADPMHVMGLGAAYLLSGSAETGLNYMGSAVQSEQAAAMVPAEFRLGMQSCVAALGGDEERARALFAELEAAPGTIHGDRLAWLASASACLGERAQAVDYLRQALAGGYTEYWDLHWIPFYAELWDYPPYRELLAELGLPLPVIGE